MKSDDDDDDDAHSQFKHVTDRQADRHTERKVTSIEEHLLRNALLDYYRFQIKLNYTSMSN